MTTTYDLVALSSRMISMLYALEPEELLQEDFGAMLDQWEMEAPDKLAALHAVSKRIDAEAQLLAGEIRRLQKAKSAITNQSERLKQYAVDLLEANERLTGERQLKAGTVVGRLSASPARLVIHDADVVPSTFWDSVPQINKKRLKEALKSDSVEGAALERGNHVRWT